MQFTNKNVINSKTQKIIWLIVGITFIILGIILVFTATAQDIKEQEQIKHLNELIIQENDKLEQKTYLDVKYLSKKIAVYDNTTNAYYLAYDGNYYYILFLKEEVANKLLDTDLETNPQKIEGVTKKVTSDIKNIFIEVLNEGVENQEDLITESNFKDILGDIYLDQTTNLSGTTNTYFIFAFISFATGLIITLINAIRLICYKINIKKLDSTQIEQLDVEMNNPDSFYYQKNKLYLTNNYIVMLEQGFKYYKYTDIIWMYPYEHRTNGIRTNKAIKIHTTDGKVHMIANITINTKANKEIYNEIWTTIQNKNQNIKLGYTKENINYMKQIKKQQKSV